MRRILKWIGIVVAALIAVIVLVIGALYTVTGVRLNRVYRIPPEAIAVPSDPGAIERGRRWASIRCAGCHGEDMAGSVVFEDPSLGRIESHNLTAGRGGDAAGTTTPIGSAPSATGSVPRASPCWSCRQRSYTISATPIWATSSPI